MHVVVGKVRKPQCVAFILVSPTPPFIMDKSHSNSDMPLNASNTVSPVKHQTAVQGIVLETPDKPVAPPAAKKIRVPVVIHPPNGTNYSLPENVVSYFLQPLRALLSRYSLRLRVNL